MLKGTARDIQQGLRLLFGVQRSVGYISQTLTTAGEQATRCNLGITVPLTIPGEADKIFQGRKPCLMLVDGRSFLVVNLMPAASRDDTTWGITYLDLVERGVRFHDLACDGGMYSLGRSLRMIAHKKHRFRHDWLARCPYGN